MEESLGKNLKSKVKNSKREVIVVGKSEKKEENEVGEDYVVTLMGYS